MSRPYTTTSVSIELVNGLILLKADVGGVYGDYILDTGASSILVNQVINEGNLWLSSLDQDFRAQEIDVNTISIGSSRYSVNEVLAVDLSDIENKINRPIAGIIGSQVLTQYNVVVDYEGGEVILMDQRQKNVNFFSSDYRVTSLPFFLSSENIISLNVTIDGKDRDYIFDTGASTNVSFSNNTTRLIQEHMISLKGVKVQKAPFLKETELNIPQWIKDSFDGVLSPYTLNAKKVVLDFSNQKIHFFFKSEEEL